MKIVGGARIWLETLIAEHQPERVVSLLSPGDAFPVVPGRSHLQLEAHDISEPRQGCRLFDEPQVASLITFVRQAPQDACIAIHCSLGVSRSPAAALVAACALRSSNDAYDLARQLRASSPTCTPNRRLIDLGDHLLRRDERLCAAVTALGRGEDYSSPVHFQILL